MLVGAGWITLVLLVAGWPVWRLGLAAGLDPSWNTALVLAHEDGLRFGLEIGYAYGPLGYLVTPASFSPSSIAGAIVYAALGGACLALAAVLGCSRRFGLRTSLVIAALVTIAAPLEIFAPEVYSLALVVLACLVAQRELSVSSTAFTAVAAVAASLQTLIKPSAGALAVLALAIAAGTADARKRNLVIGVLGYCGGVVAFWLLIAGQRLSDLVSWVQLVWSLSGGYTDAMSLEEPGRSFEYVVMAILVVGIANYAYRNILPRPDGLSGVLRVLLLSAALWVVLKEAFVRHDAHSTIAFWGIGFLALAILPRIEKRMALGALLAASIVMTSVATGIPLPTMIDPSTSVRTFFTAATAVVRTSERLRITEEAVASARSQYLVPDEMLRRIRKSEVHVDPVEVSLVRAYGLQWRPVPVFQRFQAYTELADSLNARALDSREGPEVVLRETGPVLDGRNDLWDSPRYMLALACGFAESKSSVRWQLLERRRDRCSPPMLLSSVRAEAGVSVAVPRPATRDSIVTATVTRHVSIADRLRSLVFKPADPFIVSADGLEYRVAQSPSSGPLIVRLPDGIWSPPFGGGTAYDSMRTPSKATYVFHEVELRGRPPA